VEGTGGLALLDTDTAGVGGIFTGGQTNSTDGQGGVGVYAQGGTTQDGTGVVNGLGLYAFGLPTAAIFDGNVDVGGSVSKSGGSFKIDDPIDPDNKILYHSFVESPDMLNIYNGNVITDGGGRAIVTLPAYFESLNRDFRYQLTVVGQFAQAMVASEIANNQFVIQTDKGNVKVSWQVTGIRQDAWANAHRIPNEVEKSEKEKGHYLSPELFGHAGEPSIGQIDNPTPKSAKHP
jgi:trimeric autotransporter adhesin